MSDRYAAATTVSAEKSRAEIEQVLNRYGATQFMYGRKEGAAYIAFAIHGRNVRFLLPLPTLESPDITRSSPNRVRPKGQRPKALEQATRQRWRALALVVKARLEGVAAGIESFDQAFMANLVLPGGQTVAEHALPAIEEAYRTNTQQPLLPHFGAGA